MNAVIRTSAAALGILFLFAAFIWPMASTIVELCRVSPDQISLSARQWLLFGKSVAMALAAVAVSGCLALPTLPMIAFSKARHRAILQGFAAVALLCPPIVYAFGWQRAAWMNSFPHVATVATWAGWTWSLFPLCWIAGWRGNVVSCLEEGLMAARPLTALFRCAWPNLKAQTLIACCIAFLLVVMDYGVPHTFGASVFATELLSLASSSPEPVVATALAWPLVGVGFGALLVACRAMVAADLLPFHSVRSPLAAEGVLPLRSANASFENRSRFFGRFPVVSILGFAPMFLWFLPVVFLLGIVRSPAACIFSIRVYSWDIFLSLIVSCLTGVAAILIASVLFSQVRWLGLAHRKDSRSEPTASAHTDSKYGKRNRLVQPRDLKLTTLLGCAAVLLCGAVPGAWVGAAMVMAYSHPWWNQLCDSPGVVVLALLARFGWIGVLAVGLSHRANRASIEAARLDGASPFQTVWHAVVRSSWTEMTAAAWIVAAISIGEVAATNLVRPPSFTPLMQIILEKFHRLEDDALVALSLVSAIWCGSIVIAWKTGLLSRLIRRLTFLKPKSTP